MSRLVSLLIVLLAIAVATPVLAEQRLSLSGQMRVRGLMSDNQFDYNKNANSGTSSWNDQRLRIAGRIAVAEGVSVHFRTDASVGVWGNQLPNNTQFQQAFLNVDKGMVNIKAGRMNYSVGNAILVDTQGEMMLLTIKGAVPVQIGYTKVAERSTGQAGAVQWRQDDDIDLYTIGVMHSTDMYNAVVFGGYWRDGDTQLKAYAGGVQANLKLDPVNVNFELGYVSGKFDVTGGDKVRGLQAYADVSAAVADNVTVGSDLFYAKGYARKNGTHQITHFTDDAGWRPETRGFMHAQYNMFGGPGRNVTGTLTTFDPTRDGKGVIAAQPYVRVKVMDDLSLTAAVGYWMPSEKYNSAEKASDTTAYKSFITATGSARYALAARTNLDGIVGYTKPKGANSATNDDGAWVAAFNLNVNF